MVSFYLVTMSWIYDISISENSIIQQKHVFYLTTSHHLVFSRFTTTLNQGLPLLFIKFSVLVVNPQKNFFTRWPDRESLAAQNPLPPPRAARSEEIKQNAIMEGAYSKNKKQMARIASRDASTYYG